MQCSSLSLSLYIYIYLSIGGITTIYYCYKYYYSYYFLTDVGFIYFSSISLYESYLHILLHSQYGNQIHCVKSNHLAFFKSEPSFLFV
ncbi:hypothetical protein F4703DRAFT_1898372 [Phycomyces blakesleeanus]